MNDKGCAIGGCAWLLEHPDKGCEGCGFRQEEADRRKKLTLEKGPDGLWRKDLREKPPRTWKYEVQTGKQPEPEGAQDELLRITRAELRIALTVMEAAGLCVHRSRESCRRRRKSPGKTFAGGRSSS